MISRSYDDILCHVNATKSSHVVQVYIDKPLLLPVGRRKFDIRCWVLLSDRFDGYFYKQGVVRTCSESYDQSDLSNHVSHLTNHCLQENLSKSFGLYEPNNEMFFDQFRLILKQNYNFDLNSMLESCKSIASHCLSTIKSRCFVEPDSEMQHFQVFGFDFMMDSECQVYLLEINGAPACAEMLKAQFVADLIRLQINPFFQVETHDSQKSDFEKLEISNL